MTERISLPGLEAAVDIGIDRWGIAHLRAEHESDLFFAQGFTAARDRLWQMDLWRKRGLGLLAADFGPGYLAQDWASRLFLYRGDMDAEWAAYGPDARAICTAFTRGINAYIALVSAEPSRLPPEFAAFDTTPAPWQPEDVVRIRTHGWMRNAVSELLRAHVMTRADHRTDLLRMNLEPPAKPFVPGGIELASVPVGALDLYKLAIAPVTFSEARLAATMADAWDWTRVAASGDVVRAASSGSNNWAVHGSRTSTGRPILASDPHRAYSVPSLRYLIHLTAPSIDVIGAVEPNFPGVTIGHNGRAAFGLTLFLGPDQEDVYIYQTDGDAPGAYRYRGEWEPMRIVEERFDVRGAAAQTLPLKFTRHGAIVYEHAPERQAIAVRSVWSEPGAAPYGAGLRAMRARTLTEFRDALRWWAVPAVNQMYADTAGDIAWIAAGASPIRPNWDGLLPVPGDGRYEWNGFLDAALLPTEQNPASGFVASANAMNLPADWPHADRPMGHEWDDPSRARRIDEMLRNRSGHTIRASADLQLDVLSIPARRLCAMLEPLESPEDDTARALALLREWDHRLAPESGAAALLEVWWSRFLRPGLIEQLVPDAVVRDLIAPGDVESLLCALEDPTRGPAREGRDLLLLETLGRAFRECTARMGRDPEAWAWGWLHTLTLRHAASQRLALRAAEGGADRFPAADLDPLPLGGSESTLNKGAYRTSDFQVTMGPSVRVVVDVGAWDNSLWINMPGQSGDPRSPHYADLAPLWARGEYVPMLYTREAVESAIAHRLRLEPAAR